MTRTADNIQPRIQAYGDAALLIRFECTGYSETIVKTLHHLARTLRRQNASAPPHMRWTDIVPAYDSLLIGYDPLVFTTPQARARLDLALISDTPVDQPGRTLDIPVCYGDEFGPDIGTIMASSGLSQAAVITAHSTPIYNVCMMGFIPGFAFLSEAPKALHHPRHATPRLKVCAGSIGIAGWQTGIYGLDSPGGWQIIGRTPLALFDSERDTPFVVEAGDRIRFIPSSPDIFTS